MFPVPSDMRLESKEAPSHRFLRRWKRARVAAVWSLLVYFRLPCLADERSNTSWTLDKVTTFALENRKEIQASAARVAAASARPEIVSALDDPMLSPAIDHLPFNPMSAEPPMGEAAPMSGGSAAEPPDTSGPQRLDWSVGIEQSFPLSRVRAHRRLAAEADVAREMANADKTSLDIRLAVADAFYMLQERRRMRPIVIEQIALARQFAGAARSRYAASKGGQAEVLRAEVEISRLQSRERVLGAEIRAAEAMLNASIGNPPETPVPTLESPPLLTSLPDALGAKLQAVGRRPELQAANAEVARATAEVNVMRSMYIPMATIRLGYASTMTAVDGAMVMFGVSLPIWRDKLRQGVAEAKAMEQMANLDRAAMQRMIEGETLQARASLEAAETQFTMLRDQVEPRARRLMGPALTAYAAGQGSITIVIEAARALWEAQLELVMAENAAGIAHAKLARSMAETGALDDVSP